MIDSNSQKTFVELSEYTVEDDEKIDSSSTSSTDNNTNLGNHVNSISSTTGPSSSNLVILTTSSNSAVLESSVVNLPASSSSTNLQQQQASILNANGNITIPNGHHIIITENKLNKELQFLQTAITDAGLTDLYQTMNSNQTSPLIIRSNSNNTSYVTLTPTNSNIISTSNNINNNTGHNVVTVSDMNIETILQMQCELLEQQKELKNIEIETMEQLKLLHQNINRLSKKFDSFENVISTINKVTPTNNFNSINNNNNVNVNKLNSSPKVRHIS
jgi:hypothetical protein